MPQSLEDLYQQSLEKINNAEAITEISEEIQKITDALASAKLQDWSADMISRAITKLAVYRVNLGIEMADSVMKYDYSYLNRKMRYASEWKPSKDKLNKTMKRATIQDIDSVIMRKIQEDQIIELNNKFIAERLKVLYDSTETLITALQSRLNVIKAERQEARYS